LYLENLEERTVLSVDLSLGFTGMDFPSVNSTGNNGSAPPDTIAAAGPDHIVELVNTDISIYTKTGSKLQEQDLLDFFAPVSPTTFLTDPVVSFDEQLGTNGRFVVGVLEITDPLFFSDCHLLYAVSDSSDPTQDTNGDGRAFSEMHRIDVETSGGLFGSFMDFPRFGWNADVHAFTGNMFAYNFLTGSFDFTGVQVVSIDKSTVADANPATFAYSRITGGTVHGTLAPATMHGSAPGDPMWMVEEASTDVTNRNQLRVLRFTNLLSGSPIVDQFLVNVDPYTADPITGTPPATQPGSSDKIQTNDARILNAEWRNNRLVAAQTVGLAGDAVAHARWYELSTAGAAPTLTSQQTLDPGPGIFTYFPAVAIAPSGDVGMSYMQSSNSEYMSMYVTARGVSEATMQPAVLAKGGEATYTGLIGSETSPFRAGDFSGISVDPVDGTFWAANEYAGLFDPQPAANWATWIAHFSLAGSPPPNQPPTANAGGGYSGTEDVAISFDASGSSDPDGDPLTYTWNFGDGTTLTTSSPLAAHTYRWGGNFNVSLTVSDGKGGTASAITSASVTEVNDAPVANAGGPYGGRKGQAIAFNASGSSDFDNIDGSATNNQTLTYTWTFGDGSASVTTASTTVTHTYATTGTFSVTLTVSDGLANSTATTTAMINKTSGKGGGGPASSNSVAKLVTLLNNVVSPSPAAQLQRLQQAIAAGTADPNLPDVAASLRSLAAAQDAFFTLVHSSGHQQAESPANVDQSLFQPVDEALLTDLAASLGSPSARAGKRLAF
jgi:PKD repeat protein